ncbi:MAG: cytochrome P450 [Halioglobus sp.]
MTFTHLAPPERYKAIDTLPAKPNPNLDHLPGDYGLPLFGHTWGLLTNGPKLSQEMVSRYGNVYRSSALFQRSIGLVGPDAAQFVLLDPEKKFIARPAWNGILGGLFDNGLLLRDLEDHRQHRRALQQAFKKPVLESYCGTLNQFLGDGIAAWPVDHYFDFYPAIKKLLLDNAIESFFGADPDRDVAPLNTAFIDMLNATMALVRRPLPGTAWRRGVKGREVLKAYLGSQLSARRANPGNDFFSSLCTAAEEDETALGDEDIIDHLIFLLFAAHDTTSSTLSSMVKILGKHPQWQHRLAAEFDALPSDQLQISDFQKLPETDWFFKETLRMHPPVPAIVRRLTKESVFAGHTLPANSAVFIQIRYLHYMEEYWPRPHEFDPERWSPQREEHKQHSFQWLPFGGGAHKCLGLHFAEMQTKIFLFHLLRKYRIELDPNHHSQVRYVPMEIPKNGLPVKLALS